MTTRTRTATPVPHIGLDEAGRAWIDDTNVKVIDIIFHKRDHGLKPDEIHDAFGRGDGLHLFLLTGAAPGASATTPRWTP